MRRLILTTVIIVSALALIFSFIGIKDADADATFAPSFRTDGDWITLVTVINKAPDANPSIHWMYRYDDPSTPANECFHINQSADTTPNDMFTIDISNTIDSGDPIPSGIDTTSDSFNIGPGWQGFFTLYNYTGAYPPGVALAEDTLVTEVVIANLSTGEAYSFKGPNDGLGITEGNLDDLTYGAFDGGIRVPPVAMPTAIWHPTGAVATQWYVNVVTDNVAFDLTGNPALGNTLSAVIAFADNAGNPGWWYDINETLISSIIEVDVDCFAYLTLADFIDPAGLPFAANGGWAHIQMVTPAPSAFDKGILVYKLESTSVLTGSLNSGWTSQNDIDY